MQRMQSQQLKAQLTMIRDYYLTLPDSAFSDSSIFKMEYLSEKESAKENENDQAQQWQGMVKEIKRHSEWLISDAQVQNKRILTKQQLEVDARFSKMEKMMIEIRDSINSLA